MKDNDVRETPAELLRTLDAEFDFTLDACATHANAVCPTYFTEGGLFQGFDLCVSSDVDGLTGDWSFGGGRVWCNPPFSELLEWTDKAWTEWSSGCMDTIVMLVPANRTYTTWWQKNVAPYVKRDDFTVRWRPVRDLFTVDGGKPILNKQGKVGSPSFACALLIWKET